MHVVRSSRTAIHLYQLPLSADVFIILVIPPTLSVHHFDDATVITTLALSQFWQLHCDQYIFPNLHLLYFLKTTLAVAGLLVSFSGRYCSNTLCAGGGVRRSSSEQPSALRGHSPELFANMP